MWVYSMFPGDEHIALMWVQHDYYFERGGVARLFDAARQRYLAASRLLGVDTELGLRIRDIDRFDHRTLQRAYQVVAAFYRFAIDNGGQMPLPYEERDYKSTLREAWTAYYTEEVKRLMEDDAIALATLTAVAFGNTAPGYEAEDKLEALLRQHYGPMTEVRRRWINEGYASVMGPYRALVEDE